MLLHGVEAERRSRIAVDARRPLRRDRRGLEIIREERRRSGARARGAPRCQRHRRCHRNADYPPTPPKPTVPPLAPPAEACAPPAPLFPAPPAEPPPTLVLPPRLCSGPPPPALQPASQTLPSTVRAATIVRSMNSPGKKAAHEPATRNLAQSSMQLQQASCPNPENQPIFRSKDRFLQLWYQFQLRCGCRTARAPMISAAHAGNSARHRP